MKLNLTVKTMLFGLVILGVVIIAALAFVNDDSNEKLIGSQNRLTGIVIPLVTANEQIRGAMADFFERQGSIERLGIIMGSASIEELDKLTQRTQLEEEFKQSLVQLRKLLQGKSDEEDNIKQLSGFFTDFLAKDTALLESVRSRLELGSAIDTQMEVIDHTGAELQKNAEAVSGRVNFAAMREKAALREYMNAEEKSDDLNSAVRELLAGDLTKTQKACYDLRMGVAALAAYGRQILLVKNQENISRIREESIASAAALVTASLESLEKGMADSEELTVIVRNIEKDFDIIGKTLTEVARLRSSWFEQQKQMTELRKSLKDSRTLITESLDRLKLHAQTIRDSAEQEAREITKLTRRFVGGAAFAAILAMIFIGIITFRRVIGPIKQAVSFADTIAKGDLTARIRIGQDGFLSGFRTGRGDELATLVSKLSDMAFNLNSLVGQVQKAGVQVTSSATELSATAKQQETVMANQTESANLVIKNVGEISDVSAELVETMQEVAAMSEETARFASSGQADLARMEEAIRNMEEASASISGKLEAINEKAANITSVVTTITKVADQTNLLSLNAAIEAEKAGEYGRGFTVVAREIRRLADQTAVATLDIEQMVEEMQKAVSAGVMEMDAFIKEVRHSAEDVARISTQLSRIIGQVQALTPRFETVNESMQFQSEKARNINRAMLNLGTEMQQTLESLKESFLAIEQLNKAARGLQNEVSRFKLT